MSTDRIAAMTGASVAARAEAADARRPVAAAAEGAAGFGARMRAARTRRGWIVHHLREVSGIDSRTLLKLEAGKVSPRLEQVERLADLFEVDPAELAGWRK